MRYSTILALAFAALATPALGAQAQKETFGKLPDGTPVQAVTLSNAHGMKVRVLAWGAAMQELESPELQADVA